MDYKDLSIEQKSFVNAMVKGRSVLVDACIGSGKTTTIQVLCSRLPKDKHILYLTYNRLLKFDAQAKIRQSNVYVTNYHGFAYSEMRRNKRPVSVQECIPSYVNSGLLAPHYDVLLLDEYQDIDQEIADMLFYIKQCNPDMQIAAVGDMAQKIYDRTCLDASAFIHQFLPRGYLKIEFTQCFRLSYDHAKMLGDIWKKSIVGVNPDCEICNMSYKETLNYLSSCDVGDILCLGSNNGLRSKLLNSLEKHYPRKFNKNTVWSKISEKDLGGTNPYEGVAIFTTYDGCKGMERDVCVLFDWEEDYWNLRLNMPGVRYEILRNIFCVAASRGKRKIIFVNGTKKQLSKDVLMDDTKCSGKLCDMAISGMFDYKFSEDVDAAFRELQLREIAKPGVPIHVPTNDGLIDLSPCIGIYQEAKYFDAYDIDREIQMYFEIHSDKDYLNVQSFDNFSKWTVEQKVLYFVSLETGQNRYWLQVRLPFVSNDKWYDIEKRIHTRLEKSACVQKRCMLPFYNNSVLSFYASGFADAVVGDTVYELKFVSDLAHVHFLQCAMYMVCLNKPVGIVWNIRTDQAFEVRILNRKRFLDKVARACTKRILKEYVLPKK